jgi:hypothetical protein
MVTSLSACIVFARSDDAWIWAAIGVLAGFYLFFRGFRLLARKRLIMDTPSSKIRSASLGLVEVSGLTVGPYTMTAPITAKPCYYYRTVAWQLKQSGKNKEWEKVAEEILYLPFYLDDGTGRLLVDPRDAEMDLHRDFQQEYSNSIFSNDDFIPGNAMSFLMRHGVGTDKKIRIQEYCIKPKNALFILGTIAENPGIKVIPTPVPVTPERFTLNLPGVADIKVTDSFTSALEDSAVAENASIALTRGKSLAPQQPTEVIRLPHGNSATTTSEMTQQGKIAAALTKAGITNPAAWEAAGVPYAPVQVSAAGPSSGNGGNGAAMPETASSEEFDLNPKVAILKGANNPAFIISWRSQREVVSTLGWKSALFIWGGPALTLLSAYILATHFGLL